MSEQTRDLARQMVRLDVAIRGGRGGWKTIETYRQQREDIREARSTMLRVEWAERRRATEPRYRDPAA